MNVLLILENEGEDEPVSFALVPSEKLEGIDLDEINGKDAQDFKRGDPVGDKIDEIYARLDLPGETCGRTKDKDLKPFLNPQVPFTVDKVVILHFSI